MNKVAVVSSSYYKDIIKNIIWGINEYIDDKFEIDTFSVPGSWDIVYKIWPEQVFAICLISQETPKVHL